MRLNKMGQGLPINTIILIAIGLLILVFFITFAVGGFKGLGAGASPSSSALSSFYATCDSYCTGSAATSNVAFWCTDHQTIGASTYYCGNQTNTLGKAMGCNFNGSTAYLTSTQADSTPNAFLCYGGTNPIVGSTFP
ncbi:hypothetical protein M1293_02045 [Candidatus Parvarchaeota archaeon]|nr:hypothetical protein [Candidatus Parvarchaeota archaeon]